jgi:ribose/xylose/arabinose/galactoside ABC-type transport system permease subunit
MNKIMGILLLLVYVCAASALLSDAFITPYNMQNVVRYSALYGIIGIGVSFVIITGGIDLSIGSLIALTGCILPMLLVQGGWSISAALAAVILLSLLLGLGHGLLVTKLGLQPFIVTLCGLLIYRGMARWITGDQTQGFGSGYDDSLRLLATGKPCSIAFLILVAGVLIALWCGWKYVQATKSGASGPHRRTWTAGTIIGLLLVVVGSSRFWHGVTIESSETGWLWSATVPPSAVELPQTVMNTIAQGGLVATLFGLTVTLLWKPYRPGNTASDLPEGQTRRWFPVSLSALLLPVVLLGIGGLLVGGAIWLVRQPDEWFWRGPDWAQRWRMLSVFCSLGVLMGSLGWFCKRALAVGGEAVQAPLLLTTFLSGLWLLGQTPIGQTLVPAPVIFLIVLATLAGIFLNQTIYGRYLLALGRNEEAARYSGIRTDRMVILAYVLCAGASGIGGILFALDANSVQPAGHGNFLELYAIAAAVLGGCSLRGGEGTVLGVIIGAAVMRVLYNSINILGIPSQLEFAIIGMVILIGVLADELVKRLAARRRMAM